MPTTVSAVTSLAMAAASLVRPCVRFIIGMTMRAVCFRRIASTSHGGTDAADEVLSHRDGFKMLRPNTSSITAEVIDGQPLGDWPDQQFINGTMSLQLPAPSTCKAIAILVSGTSPQPARRSLIDVIPNAVFKWNLRPAFPSMQPTIATCWTLTPMGKNYRIIPMTQPAHIVSLTQVAATGGFKASRFDASSHASGYHT